ncbi:hypothetical protein RM704_02315 [Streptomyces sp. DSM 3412]|uniref:Uncharacterized protein n=1 Tax=Streptomyces gottesmaniae TaxID=3075518 RepID=A0ABU2YPQ7_9ACTN|nr:hypothetical protein [Streptomyces sp. DSM 3412]MDT0566319.1 hypothetical protein [Streptomyces sp. DSM 3412]
MIHYGLPDRLLLACVEPLTFTDPTFTRPRNERFVSSASHFAHRLTTALSLTSSPTCSPTTSPTHGSTTLKTGHFAGQLSLRMKNAH